MSELPPGTPWAVVVLLVLLAGLGLGAVALTGVRPLQRPSFVLCLVGAPVWVLTNAPLEGPVLLVVFPGNGLTLADLLAFAAVGVGALVLRDLRAAR